MRDTDQQSDFRHIPSPSTNAEQEVEDEARKLLEITEALFQHMSSSEKKRAIGALIADIRHFLAHSRT